LNLKRKRSAILVYTRISPSWHCGHQTRMFSAGCPGPCRVLSSVPGRHPLYARSCPVVTAQMYLALVQGPLRAVTPMRSTGLHMFMVEKTLTFSSGPQSTFQEITTIHGLFSLPELSSVCVCTHWYMQNYVHVYSMCAVFKKISSY
jgi:hypothetical protein